jgi:DNA-binding NtrC family response regulator
MRNVLAMPRGLRRRRVLVVDNDGEARHLLRIFLTRGGFDVVEAASVREALATFDEKRPDVVVTELFIPEADGFELIRRLHRLTPEVPVVVLSCGGQLQDDAAMNASRLFGAVEALWKPASRAAILDAVRRALERAGG